MLFPLYYRATWVKKGEGGEISWDVSCGGAEALYLFMTGDSNVLAVMRAANDRVNRVRG